jgi:DNA-binding transcriptional LysR family regulator
LNIAYLSNSDFELLPRTLGAFRQAFPHISLNLFDMAPAEQLRALEARKIDLGFVGLPPRASTGRLKWESIAQHRTVVVLPTKHPLARQSQVSLTALKKMFFVGMSEKTHPGFREWLGQTCQAAGFIPRVLQDAELEPALMTFVADGLGVSLAREHIKKLPHPGVALRPLAPAVTSDYCIAWNRDNDSRALQQYIEIVKSLAARGH